jgi:uncharacterized protein YdhG (YjbR/CyaY superfamily)
MPATKKTTRTSETFSDEERAAMKERQRELRSKKGDGEADVLAKLAEMDDADRAIGERIHSIVKESAPGLSPKTWYGMPAYAKDGKIVCFFQAAAKFKALYATLGFNEDAHLDDGAMWPTSWAITKLTAAEEKRIVELITKAVS